MLCPAAAVKFTIHVAVLDVNLPVAVIPFDTKSRHGFSRRHTAEDFDFLTSVKVSKRHKTHNWHACEQNACA